MLVENLNIVKGGKFSRYGRSTALVGSLHAMLNQQHLATTLVVPPSTFVESGPLGWVAGWLY